MNVAGIPLRSVVELAREAQAGAGPAGPVVVDGPLAPQLARELGAGAEPGAIRVGGGVTGASAVVVVLTGPPDGDRLALLRRADSEGVPLVAVQTGPGGSVPYVLPHLVVDCEPGRGFPVGGIAAALADALGKDAAAVAARVPVVRPHAERVIARGSAAAAAGIAARSRPGTRLSALVPLQARMLRSLAAARGRSATTTPQEVGVTVGAGLGSALAAGLAARALVRRLPIGGRVVDAVVAAAVTYGLAAARRRVR
jgi:uncharacterized protein (DUF697 family)